MSPISEKFEKIVPSEYITCTKKGKKCLFYVDIPRSCGCYLIVKRFWLESMLVNRRRGNTSECLTHNFRSQLLNFSKSHNIR